jgi:hypothetical protein
MEKTSPQKRYPTLETVAFKVYGQHGAHTVRMKNLSATGAFFEIQDPRSKVSVTKGDLIRLDIHLATLKKSHVVDAEIVWSQPNGFGVSFITKEQLLEKMILRS